MRTLLSLLIQFAVVTGVPLLPVTVRVVVSPERSTGRSAVIWSPPAEGEVGVEELSQPATRTASPARTVATRRDVTRRL